jgi:hypothetical protein
MNLLARLSLDGSGFIRGLAAARGAAAKFGRDTVAGWKADIGGKLQGAFGFTAITAGLTAFAHKVVSTADHIGDLSDQLDMTTDDIQRMQVAAGRNGLGEEDLITAFRKIGQARKAALDGDVGMRKTFADAGIGLEELAGLTDKLALAKRVYGAAGAGVLSLRQQSDLFDTAGKKGERLAATMRTLENLGPISLLKKSDMDDLSKVNDALAEMVRQSVILAAPPAGFIGRRIERLNAAKGAGETAQALVEQIFPGFGFIMDRKRRSDAEEAARNAPPGTPPPPDAPKALRLPKSASLIGPSDSLAKVGLFVGGAGNPIASQNHTKIALLRRQVALLERIASTGADANRTRP